MHSFGCVPGGGTPKRVHTILKHGESLKSRKHIFFVMSVLQSVLRALYIYIMKTIVVNTVIV
jgi:hypothetical protein